jgi:hypothetical protein
VTDPTGERRDDVADGQRGTVAHLWSVVGGVVAPVTLVTAVLFYFGYVHTRAMFGYFGLDVGLLGFSTQDFVMRSPVVLLVPLLVLLLGAALLLLGDGLLRRRLEALDPDTHRRRVHTVVVVGAVVLVAGVALTLAFPAVGGWVLYPLVTPVVLGTGAGLAVYGAALARRLPAPSDQVSPSGPDHARPTVMLLLLSTVVTALFWATATLAQWAGYTQADDLAADLTVLPAVVLDTPQQLQTADGVVEQQALEADDDDRFQWRYTHLRLLAEGAGHLFLVPDRWTSDGATLVVPIDEVRISLPFPG